MTQDELKALVGQAAVAYVVPGAVIGVGTGSTVNFFIDALASRRARIKTTVASSEASAARLRSHHIPGLSSLTTTARPGRSGRPARRPPGS